MALSRKWSSRTGTNGRLLDSTPALLRSFFACLDYVWFLKNRSVGLCYSHPLIVPDCVCVVGGTDLQASLFLTANFDPCYMNNTLIYYRWLSMALWLWTGECNLTKQLSRPRVKQPTVIGVEGGWRLESEETIPLTLPFPLPRGTMPASKGQLSSE